MRWSEARRKIRVTEENTPVGKLVGVRITISTGKVEIYEARSNRSLEGRVKKNANVHLQVRK